MLEFCRAELIQENYFHAVLEATKSLSAKIREKSGLTTDAAELAMSAFGLGKADIPYLAFNSLQTETHKKPARGIEPICRNVRDLPKRDGSWREVDLDCD